MHLFLICVFDTWALLLGLYGRYFYIVLVQAGIDGYPADLYPANGCGEMGVMFCPCVAVHTWLRNSGSALVTEIALGTVRLAI